MKRSHVLLSLALSMVTIGLAGCGGFSSAGFPDASINPEQSSLGSIQGSNFGGHAPLVGSHVYVLQPGITGYGSQATSLLTGTTAGGSTYTTTKNTTDPGIPTSWYYETTDTTGAFNISGDYTCTVGLPVYLYIYGGSPTFPSASNVFTTTQVVVSNETGILGLGGTATYTFTTTTPENFYVGEQVVLSGYTGNLALLNGSQTVLATNLTTSTFAVSAGTYLLEGTGTQTVTATATAQPTFNPGIVNLAVLGNCPSGSTDVGFGSSIKYVYVNEVATTAAAYAFAPFTLPASSATVNNYAIDIGTDSGNIAGIQNAALIAGQLYDIQGSNVSTTYAGEGHIARATTTAGNGIIPQANIDTIGNILAACVDSQNTATTLGASGATGANMSTQCSMLYNYATSTGIPVSSTGSGANAPGQPPFDIAQAAINIARHPAGAPYSYTGSTGISAFVTALYGLPTGNIPFAPALTTQPNDFTIGIDYTAANNPASSGGGYMGGAESLAIDKIGNVWSTSQLGGNHYFYEISPTGVVSNVNHNSSYIYGYVTIDSGESAWVGAAISTNPVTYVHATLTPSAVSGSAPVSYTYNSGVTSTSAAENYTYSSTSDASGNVYFGNNKTAGSSLDYIQTFTGAATNPAVTATESAAITGVSTDGSGFSHAAVDAAGYGYFNYNASNGAGTPTIDRAQLSSASNASGFPVTNATAGCTSLLDPEQMAVVKSGDLLQPDYHNGSGGLNAATSSLYYITSAGVCTRLSGATYEAGLYSPFGATIDGNDYAYVTNRGGNTISVFNMQSGTAAGVTAVSPSTGYEPQYMVGNTLTAELSGPLNIAADPSGNVWVTDYGNSSIVEIVGLAAPTTTPLSVASNGKIGTKP